MNTINNVGQIFQRLGKIGINLKKKNVNDENQPCIGPGNNVSTDII